MPVVSVFACCQSVQSCLKPQRVIFGTFIGYKSPSLMRKIVFAEYRPVSLLIEEVDCERRDLEVRIQLDRLFDKITGTARGSRPKDRYERNHHRSNCNGDQRDDPPDAGDWCSISFRSRALADTV